MSERCISSSEYAVCSMGLCRHLSEVRVLIVSEMLGGIDMAAVTVSVSDFISAHLRAAALL